MSKNFLVNFILLIWTQVIAEVVYCQMTPFKPSVVYDHTATYIDNKLYILSGVNLKGEYIGKEFFYLDVSVPFNTQQLLWHDLTNINMLPPHGSAASAKGGENNDTIILCGGYTSDNIMALIYTFAL
ncbi:hypothetical protein GLOIN_2v1780468 [Rhizophagus clarus]|uniref:Glyoxal oxidase N-terminal domain-containing protein n=1 Tax=Rhizophagus clarus TaxID=94130 RepID=A0A8H3LAS1_9GLOM|nr:hypothetical protein GLOIN_2v1780468 [Rhizophagus clarus]